MSLPIEVGPNPNSLATVGTLVNGQVSATIQSGIIQYVGTIGTLLTAASSNSNYIGTLASLGTVGTIISGQVTASVSSGQLTDVATIGTILSPMGLTATITSPVIALQAYKRSTIVSSAAVVSGTAVASTLICATLQDMVVDVVYGTVVSGSILASVVGMEPIQSIQTGTVTQGVWFAGTVQGAERLIALGPLGEYVVVKLTQPASSTVLAVTVTAEQSTTG